MTEDCLLHQAPVWRDKADFIINARTEDLDDGRVQWWEQLWTRELPGHRYELCCIPFGVSDLSLGDLVETATVDGRPYVLHRVIKPSGHSTLRICFSSSATKAIRDEVTAEITRLGCLFERLSPVVLVIDAATPDLANAVKNYLAEQEQRGRLTIVCQVIGLKGRV